MNAISANAPALPVMTLSDCQSSAIKIFSLLQAAVELYDQVPSGNGAAANGLHALLEVIQQRAEALASDLEAVERGARE
ncbi:hypothetical protein LAZ29_12210 [Cereibacter sphaeroides]|uniref:hypothetical protein n=1 Tax=Cereibacter sphaeroides TaxID=1063 RepID=UPI001F378C96|nr:hypothetical protein [Cereibacter sphaeroides]MCE6951691.1 hypothetical protein [Cereibacter sphaeroides]